MSIAVPVEQRMPAWAHEGGNQFLDTEILFGSTGDPTLFFNHVLCCTAR